MTQPDYIAQMAWADESIDGFVNLVKQAPHTTPELFEAIIASQAETPHEEIIFRLGVMVATAIQKLATT